MGAPNVSAIVPAAGLSKRFSRDARKQFAPLGGRPLVTYCLSTLESSELVTSVVVVVPGDGIERSRELLRSLGFAKIKAVVGGGDRRCVSVRNGFGAVPAEADVVLVHDAARPFVDLATIKRVIDGCAETGASVCAVPVTDTLKESDGRGRFVSRTVPRERLWRAQTPQAFRAGVLREIYSSADPAGLAATDEALLAEAAGIRVSIVPGSEFNIKVATPADFALGELMIRNGAADV